MDLSGKFKRNNLSENEIHSHEIRLKYSKSSMSKFKIERPPSQPSHCPYCESEVLRSYHGFLHQIQPNKHDATPTVEHPATPPKNDYCSGDTAKDYFRFKHNILSDLPQGAPSVQYHHSPSSKCLMCEFSSEVNKLRQKFTELQMIYPDHYKSQEKSTNNLETGNLNQNYSETLSQFESEKTILNKVSENLLRGSSMPFQSSISYSTLCRNSAHSKSPLSGAISDMNTKLVGDLIVERILDNEEYYKKLCLLLVSKNGTFEKSPTECERTSKNHASPIKITEHTQTCVFPDHKRSLVVSEFTQTLVKPASTKKDVGTQKELLSLELKALVRDFFIPKDGAVSAGTQTRVHKDSAVQVKSNSSTQTSNLLDISRVMIMHRQKNNVGTFIKSVPLSSCHGILLKSKDLKLLKNKQYCLK